MVSNLTDLVARLKGIPSKRWEAIATAAGCTPSLPRKVVYEWPERNFGIKTLEPLFAFFNDLDAGRRDMPAEEPAADDAKAAA
jgi:hypothetical protein